MLKILNTSQIREVDAFTIKNEPIASIDLMERACCALVKWFTDRFSKEKSVLIICGTGNNGGDGLGVARLLAELGYSIKVFVIRLSNSQSVDFKENLNRLPKSMEIVSITERNKIDFPSSDIVIDAILGSGLSRPLEGFAVDVVTAINKLDALRIAIDCPSGFMMDSPTTGVSVQVHHTVVFQIPRLSFLFPQSYSFAGHWHLVDIGLDKVYIDTLESNYFLIDEVGIRKLVRSRNKFGHKGNYGHSLVIAGSKGKIGANILSTRSAMRIGSGLTTSLTPGCGYLAIQTAVPEAMVITAPSENYLSQLPDLSSYNSIGVGPGIGVYNEVADLLASLLSKNIPCVLDADALNILSVNPELQKQIPEHSILTPHPGEFKRWVGDWHNDFEKLDKQKTLALRLNSIIILKGAHTTIALPDGSVYFNNTGNSAMATGGSGDVLTGILTGLKAQGYSSVDASILGVYIHGLAGDLAASDKATILASDIIEEIPHALKWLSFDK